MNNYKNNRGKNLNFRTLMMLGSAFAIFASASAVAQEQPLNSDTKIRAMDEIIVTALKRGDQSLVEVPAGISVISGDDIENFGADGLEDFLQMAPGVSIDQGLAGVTTAIQIRGVNATFGSASVGFYLDDLPFSFINVNVLPDPSPFDLDRIEILKGPQGTLYGAGSAGGVVLIRTRDPVLNEFSGKIDVSLSSTDGGGENYSTSGAINIPLIKDIAALRATLSYQDNGGWIDDTLDPSIQDLNSEKRLNGRVKLRITPNDKLSVNLIAAFSDLENNLNLDIGDDSGNYPFSLTAVPGFEPKSEADYQQYGAVVSYDFPRFTITNALSYLNFESDQNNAFPLPVLTFVDLSSTVNEFRVNSNHDGPLSWVGGVYSRKSDQTVFQNLDFLRGVLGIPPGLNPNDQTASEQYSIFGEATLALMDGALELSAGASYFNDKTENSGDVSPVIPTPVILNVETKEFLPQATIAYHPSEDTTLYFRYAEGLRAGTTNFSFSTLLAQFSVPTVTGIVDPELHQALEIGAKGEFFNGTVYAEIAAFHIDINDIQQAATVQSPGGGVAVDAVLNAGDARSKGFEWLVSIQPTDALELSFSGAYTKAEIQADFFAPGSDPTAPGNTPLFAQGTRLNLVPELTLNGSVTYNWALGIGGLDATASGNIQYSSDRALTILSEPSLLGDNITRANLRFEVGKDNWSVYAFMNNIGNEDGVISPSESFSTFQAFGIPTDGLLGTRPQPRTTGAGLRFNF